MTGRMQGRGSHGETDVYDPENFFFYSWTASIPPCLSAVDIRTNFTTKTLMCTHAVKVMRWLVLMDVL